MSASPTARCRSSDAQPPPRSWRDHDDGRMIIEEGTILDCSISPQQRGRMAATTARRSRRKVRGKGVRQQPRAKSKRNVVIIDLRTSCTSSSRRDGSTAALFHRPEQHWRKRKRTRRRTSPPKLYLKPASACSTSVRLGRDGNLSAQGRGVDVTVSRYRRGQLKVARRRGGSGSFRPCPVRADRLSIGTARRPDRSVGWSSCRRAAYVEFSQMPRIVDRKMG